MSNTNTAALPVHYEVLKPINHGKKFKTIGFTQDPAANFKVDSKVVFRDCNGGNFTLTEKGLVPA